MLCEDSNGDRRAVYSRPNICKSKFQEARDRLEKLDDEVAQKL